MKFHNLQALRAIAAYLVVFVHLEDVERKYGNGHILGLWADSGSGGVDLFFVLSGFVMVYISTNRVGSPRESANFLWNRATRIYPLWWLCLTALVMVWLVAPQLVYGGEGSFNAVTDYLLLYKGSSPLLEVGWTLVHEMYFYFVFALMLLLPIDGSARFKMILVWGAVVGSVALFWTPDINSPLRLMLHPMTLEFVIGAIAAMFWMRTKGTFGNTALILGTIMFIAGMIDQAMHGNTFVEAGTYGTDWLRVMRWGVGGGLIVYGMASLESRNIYKANSFSVKLGDWSYSLYLTHMLTLNAVGQVWKHLALPGIWDSLIWIPLLLVACTVVSALTYKLFERPMIHISRRFSPLKPV